MASWVLPRPPVPDHYPYSLDHGGFALVQVIMEIPEFLLPAYKPFSQRVPGPELGDRRQMPGFGWRVPTKLPADSWVFGLEFFRSRNVDHLNRFQKWRYLALFQ